MKKRKLGEIILVGVVAVVFFATISKGASFGQRIEDRGELRRFPNGLEEVGVPTEMSGRIENRKQDNIELTGVLTTALEGRHDLLIEVSNQEGNELLFSKEFKGVEINDGFYTLKIDTQEAGLEAGKSYGLRITVLGEEEVPVTEAKLEIVPELTVRAFEEEENQGVTTGLYNLVGTFAYPDAVVTVTNRGTGFGIKSVSQKGVGLHAESNSVQGYGLYAKNTAGGTALLAEGKTKLQGDLEVTGQTSLTLPADSVGSAQIQDGTIVNADISAGANIDASKINRANLDADQLDGKDSSEFLATNPIGDLTLGGNLTVNGTGNNYFAGNVGIGTNTPSAELEVSAAGQASAIHVDADSNQESALYFLNTGSPKTALYRPSDSDDLRIWASASARDIITFKNDGSGNMGIGTTEPGAKFHIAADNPNFLLQETSGGTGLRMGIDGTGVFLEPYNGAPSIRINSNPIQIGLFLKGDNGNVGIGTTSPAATLHVNGNILASGTIEGNSVTAHYQDLAEWVVSSQNLEAGTVVVIDPNHNNQVIASILDYDSKVAGVVSEQPGFILGQGGENQYPIVHTGRVKVNVDARYGAITIGDLLVTSPEPGVAMKSQPKMIEGDEFHRPGTILGKALESLAEGTGEILVLLSLQ